MQFYRFDGSLKSSGDTPPEKWENALAVLTSREAEEIPLPPELVPPEMPPMVNQTQFCVLKMQQKRMTGSIHIPARHQRRAIRFTFAWSGENLLLLDDGGFVSGFIERMTALVPKFADGANDFLANGCALLGLIDIVKHAGAKIAGAGIVIEKGCQKGGELVRSHGIRVESLAIIDEMDPVKGCKFRDDD